MKKRIMLSLILIGSSVTTYLHASLLDSRILKINYKPGEVTLVHAKTFFTTQVIFGENESIVSVQSGDADAWTISVDKNIPNVMTLKPTLSGSHSNINVVTTNERGRHRYYRFEVKSFDHNNAKSTNATYAIKFLYDMPLKLMTKKNITKIEQDYHFINSYNKMYSISGEGSLLPKMVYDDRVFTYVEFPEHATIPAIFEVNERGEEFVVNFRKRKNTLVVQGVFSQLTLRYGRDKATSIFNDELICHQMPYRCKRRSHRHGKLYKIFHHNN